MGINGLKIPKWYTAKAPRTGPSLTNALNLLIDDGVNFDTIIDMPENLKEGRGEAKLERDGNDEQYGQGGGQKVRVRRSMAGLN